MFQLIRSFVQKEVRHFRALSDSAQNVLVSYAIYEFVYPLIVVFVNAFILRQTNDFLAVALYNLGTFLSLPAAFYLNGLVLRKVHLNWPYLIGVVGQGLVACLVFFVSFHSLPALFAFGVLQGVPMGLFWANRNFISLDITHDENRNYFTGLEVILSTIAATTTPFVVGWVLELGGRFGLFAIDRGYRALGVVSLFLLFWAGKKITTSQLDQPKFRKLWVGKASSLWNTARLVELARGIQNGLDLFIIPLVIFNFLGKEGSLGTMQSIAAIVGVVILYSLARFLKPAKRLITLRLDILALVCLALIFALGFSPLTALIYVIFAAAISHISWMASNPISMKTIDQEDGGDNTDNYAYVCDREMFLNIGRFIGVVIFLALISLTSQQVGLRFMPVIAALSQVIFYLYVAKLDAKR